MLNKQRLLCAFLFLISGGLVFDAYNKINQYGWNYNVTYIINDVSVTTVVYSSSNIIFAGVFSLFFFLSVWVLWQIAEIS